MWDEHGHGCLTLSYERFLFPLDVFPGEFVILSTWADAFFGKEEDESLYRR